MATTLTLSLFLPNTVSFSELPAKEARHNPALQLHRRATSDLPNKARTSTASLFDQLPGAANLGEKEFADDELKRLFAKPGDPRSLLRSDTHAEWGRQDVFNQPRSRALPLPSASIQDFAKAYDQIKEDNDRARQKVPGRVTRMSPSDETSRSGSSERGYEGKTWTVQPALHGNGGLVNAIRQVSDADGSIDFTWIGTLGMPTDALPTTIRDEIRDRLLNEFRSEVVFASDKDIDGHYAHYCKTILWPIFHYQVPDHPKSKAYADHSWDFYRNVNRAFADQAISSYKRGDTIWVHDYHLLLVPAMIREKLPEAKIGFFLHTAFPSSEVFRCLSTRKELLEGMLGANLIGFQCDEYSSHFLQTCSRLLAVETTADGVQLEDHFVNVSSMPIGINPSLFEEIRQSPEVKKMIDLYGEKYKDKIVICARDRLDFVHGVRQKLLAYELFLNRHPEWREKVCMIQVATSTNDQSELLAQVSDISSRIDSVHATLNHQPLLFLAQDIPFAQYLAMISIADVFMISALRDGMNLTAHEYIYCQDGAAGSPKKHGPLILSEFTGSAVVFEDNHLSINPWDYSGQAEAINDALKMSSEEKERRWTRLQEIVMSRTGTHWVHELSRQLDQAYDEHHQRASAAVPRLSVPQLSEKYKESNCRLFIIDYEGTLANHKTASGIPLGSPARIVEALDDLMNDPRNILYVMSGRKPEELENHFRMLPRAGLIAENGCFVREFGGQSDEWMPFVDLEEVNKWKNEVRGILEYYQERLEGSYIEERKCSLLFRYEKCQDQEAAVRQAGESADQINGSCKSMHIHAVPIKGSVLIEQEDFSKGTAAKHVYDMLRTDSKGITKPDFMLVAGDDREDEVIYQWANDLGESGEVKDVFTVTVGKRNTLAHSTLTQGSTGLLSVLQKLAKISLEQSAPDYFNLPRSSTFPA
ncbi:related to alpha,alpha-trehalose-phosphate synthase (UDP-forming) [Ramularia collo-cygni]|uniref:Related to alpha,alpha-trehalose-phosphate synthase (UDP-forming) n=1 Tax=Ramularia collo-cygni TaxID=112498 RepID=A0A2D3V6P3_9PEZI|nr:related to alpha,alpha-trehalose-phosphate synthase (UDP-forming) [Ramularia collo-cygni]CZT18204.1 related to alpha,alpha-trehalose-phosphate synthase (UDP-forming) [Ramularia collo-cygni]